MVSSISSLEDQIACEDIKNESIQDKSYVKTTACSLFWMFLPLAGKATA